MRNTVGTTFCSINLTALEYLAPQKNKHIAELINGMRANGFRDHQSRVSAAALHPQSRSKMERAERQRQPNCRAQYGP